MVKTYNNVVMLNHLYTCSRWCLRSLFLYTTSEMKQKNI